MTHDKIPSRFATPDFDRERRTGFPEVVMGEGKSTQQIVAIATAIYNRSDVVLVTRTTQDVATALEDHIPDVNFTPSCGAAWADARAEKPRHKGVTVVCAGTSDLSVADEACLTAELMLCEVNRLTDVGVAGIHRLLQHRAELESARVAVVVAGMDGALPSVVAGLVRAPVIAVPTSVGYGTGLGGFAAMLNMLNSCSAGVSVVNIDAGFSAGYQAALIAGAGQQP